MGCDIHMFCEELKTIDDTKKWVNADHWKLNPYFGVGAEEEKFAVVELYRSRHYSMFTALCGVRDYTGQSPKISEPRGAPADCTEEVTNSIENWDCDGHSHSYVTLREVKEFVKNSEPVKFSGLITQAAADALDNDSVAPTSWCQGSGVGKNMVFREWEDGTHQPLQELYELMAERFNEWRKPDDIDEDTLDNFRIVFWFDT